METIVTFGSCNRITIPKDIVENLNLKQGTKFKLITYDNDIIIYRINSTVDNKEITNKKDNIDISKNEKENSHNEKVDSSKRVNQEVVKGEGHRFKRKIVSNLEEGKNFYAKYYSPCKLVIRTKNRYLKKFCEECQGFLVKEDKEKQDMCPYYKQEVTSQKQDEDTKQIETSKTIKTDKDKRQDKQKESVSEKEKIPIQQKQDITKVTAVEIKENVDKLNNIIDDKIKTINNVPSGYFKQYGSKSIKPVKSDKYFYQCCKCQELVKSGFVIDDEFYCSQCTKKDFKHFVKMINKLKREDN